MIARANSVSILGFFSIATMNNESDEMLPQRTMRGEFAISRPISRRQSDRLGRLSDEMLDGLAEAQARLTNFWPDVTQRLTNADRVFLRTYDLPLARVKKIVKMDETVNMISCDVSSFLSKAAEYFIGELTLRAWVSAQEGGRRTVQRSDVCSAVSRSEQYDFLIDIVPRDDIKIVVTRSQYPQQEVQAPEEHSMVQEAIYEANSENQMLQLNPDYLAFEFLQGFAAMNHHTIEESPQIEEHEVPNESGTVIERAVNRSRSRPSRLQRPLMNKKRRT
ncbi:hypothetical protein ACOME3_000144 [Neoechinorhynchus agilis]